MAHNDLTSTEDGATRDPDSYTWDFDGDSTRRLPGHQRPHEAQAAREKC